MAYVSLNFYLFVAALLAVYYLLPLGWRWWVLLAGSAGFYYWLAADAFWILAATIGVSFGFGLLLDKIRRLNRGDRQKEKIRLWQGRACLTAAVLTVLAPLLLVKHSNFWLASWFGRGGFSWIVPLGISFYTLQIIAYLVDIYKGKIRPQRNIWRYALFVSFFPQIVQGPIPRYEQLGEQLYTGHCFDERTFSKGLQLILWGFFLKFMIADKAGVIVDTVFDGFPVYQGAYVLVGGVLACIQVYTDFLACTSISRGVAGLFGIELMNNFKRPYLATEIRFFWSRWHISFSRFLRDYIYFPLGGSKKGRLKKFRNLWITFAVSGAWHGTGYNYIFWGLLHATYMVVGELTRPFRDRIYAFFKVSKDSMERVIIQICTTFFLCVVARIICWAKDLRTGLEMVWSMFSTYNPWVFFDDSLFKLGLGWKECMVLLAAVVFLILVEVKQEKLPEGQGLRDWLLERHLVVRWSVYLAAVCLTWIFGTYGFGFEAKDFIYGGF